MIRRDPSDERREERLAGSSLASLLLHLLAAAFLVSIAAASSQETSNETVQGGQLITVSQQLPAEPTQAITPAPAPPQPPVHHVVVPPEQRPQMHPVVTPQPQRHELKQIVPSASPNPTPAPQFTPQPLPVPTERAVALEQPTLAPTPRPTREPTPKPEPTTRLTPRPQATPRPVSTARPQPTARPVPTAVPTHAPTHAPATIAPAPVIARTAAPRATIAAAPRTVPSPVAHPSLAPANRAGVPSPHPVIAEHPTTGRASPGPQSPSIGREHVPQRPISVPPTPSPARTERPHPEQTRNPYAGLNARLNSLIPRATVTPHEGHYVGSLTLTGRLVPTPPPDVLARTRYIFQGPYGGGDGTLKMWVESVTRRGPVLICNGWILHFPAAVAQSPALPPHVAAGPANGIQIGGEHQVPSGFAAGLAPIVVGEGTTECTERALVPFTP